MKIKRYEIYDSIAHHKEFSPMYGVRKVFFWIFKANMRYTGDYKVMRPRTLESTIVYICNNGNFTVDADSYGVVFNSKDVVLEFQSASELRNMFPELLI